MNMAPPINQTHIQNVLNIDLEDLPESELGPKLVNWSNNLDLELVTYIMSLIPHLVS
jgi:hypothetical protein